MTEDTFSNFLKEIKIKSLRTSGHLKSKFKKIDTEFFKEIINSKEFNHSVNMTYVDKNPIIRWLWWKRWFRQQPKFL